MTERIDQPDDYEQTTGHAITCTAAFTGICDCPPAHDSGPSVREAAEVDHRWFDGEKAGE